MSAGGLLSKTDAGRKPIRANGIMAVIRNWRAFEKIDLGYMAKAVSDSKIS